MAYKYLSAEEYAQADAGLREARLALQDREEKLMTVYNQVETGMSLIGATAVEDRWVLTHTITIQLSPMKLLMFKVAECLAFCYLACFCYFNFSHPLIKD